MEQPSHGNASESRLGCTQGTRRGGPSLSLSSATVGTPFLLQLSVPVHLKPLFTHQLPGQTEGITQWKSFAQVGRNEGTG